MSKHTEPKKDDPVPSLEDLSGFLENISNRMCAEEAFRPLVLHAPIGIYMARHGRFLATNPSFRRITGYSEEELQGRSSLEIVHPNFREEVRENALRMLKSGNLDPFEFQIITRRGEVKWVMESITQTWTSDERTTLGYFMDISHVKDIEKALARSEKKYRELFRHASIGIVQFSIEGKPLRVNEIFALMMGYESVREFMDRVLDVSRQVYQLPREWTRLLATIRQNQGSVTGFETNFRRRNGTSLPVNIHARLVLEAWEEAPYIEAFIEDISHRKRMESLLEDARDRLEKRVVEQAELLVRREGQLEQTSTTLKVVKDLMEQDHQTMENTMVTNLKLRILPSLHKLKQSHLNADQKACVEMMERHIQDITSRFATDLYQSFSCLSPAEIRIADFIRDGLSIKDISDILGLSEHTVISQRQSIRRKLGLKDRSCNLRKHLQDLAAKT